MMIMMLWFSLLHIWRKICSKFGEEFVVGVSDFDVELLYFGGKIVVFGEKTVVRVSDVNFCCGKLLCLAKKLKFFGA